MCVLNERVYMLVCWWGNFWPIVFVSVLGFAAFLLLDVPQVYTRPRVTALIALSAAAMLATAFYMALHVGTPFPMPWWGRLVGWILFIFGLGFTFFVVFVEIPWRLRCGGQEGPLVVTGTYAACRHPGFWGVVVFCLGSVLTFPRTGMLTLGLWWIVLEWIVVWVQDRWLLPRRFPAYATYQQRTPFLVPSRLSLQTMRSTWSCRTANAANLKDGRGGEHETVSGKDQ